MRQARHRRPPPRRPVSATQGLVCYLVGSWAVLPVPLVAQQSDALRQGVAIALSHGSFPNLTYVTASGYEAKLDVYASQSPTPAPTLVYYHGGGWVGGSKEGALLETMPYLAMGWTVVDVEYRLAGTALAPAGDTFPSSPGCFRSPPASTASAWDAMRFT